MGTLAPENIAFIALLHCYERENYKFKKKLGLLYIAAILRVIYLVYTNNFGPELQILAIVGFFGANLFYCWQAYRDRWVSPFRKKQKALEDYISSLSAKDLAVVMTFCQAIAYNDREKIQSIVSDLEYTYCHLLDIPILYWMYKIQR